MLVLYLRDRSWRSSLRELFSNTHIMDQLVADFLSRMGLPLPVAILVAVRGMDPANQYCEYGKKKVEIEFAPKGLSLGESLGGLE